MTRVEKQISAFLLVVLSLGLIGCSNDKDDAIRQYLVHSEEQEEYLVDGANFQMFKAYRDGRKDGIVWFFFVGPKEYSRMERGEGRYAREEFKADLISGLREKGVKEVADMGIYFRYIFASIDGEREIEYIITSSDFEN